MPNRIREFRKARAKLASAAYSPTALAARLGVSELTLYRWETGQQRPRKAKARALAREFGVKVEELQLDAPAESESDAQGEDIGGEEQQS